MSISPAAVTPAFAAGLGDDDLMDAQRSLASLRRMVDAAAAVIASEIRARSSRELGYKGLAQRLGARTPELLVQQLTGSTAREAHTLVRVGSLMAAASGEPSVDTPTWLRGVAAAVASGRLSIDAADVIRSGLGEPDDEVTAAALADAAATLLAEATAPALLGGSITVERLAARARELRNQLDLSRVKQREDELRARRYLRVFPQPDGMTRMTGLLDPESAALVTSAFDGATSPRRGGPRFVDAAARDREDELLRDERTTEQLALDGFVELIRIGGAADTAKPLGGDRPAVRVLVAGEPPARRVLVGGKRPSVRVLVTDHDLRERRGYAHIEGQTEAVSIQTAERHICEAGSVPILFDGSEVLELGREARLFTQRQRIALAARDGGCIVPGCGRPPSWCEAHHIVEWSHNGKTDVADGVLLCRHHHMLVHNNGWRVLRQGDEYFLLLPTALDPQQVPIPCPSKSPALRRLRATG